MEAKRGFFYNISSKMINGIVKAIAFIISLKPDDVLDKPIDKLFYIVEAIISTTYKSILNATWWILMIFMPPVSVFIAFIIFASFAEADYITSLLITVLDIGYYIIAFYIARGAYSMFKPIYEEYKKPITEFSIRKTFCVKSGKYLGKIALLSIVTFLVLFFSIDDDSSAKIVLLFLLSIVVFWLSWYFSGYRQSAQIVMLFLIASPFMYYHVEANPHKFPNSWIHESKNIKNYKYFPQPTSYLKSNLSTDNAIGVDNNYQLVYPVYRYQDNLEVNRVLLRGTTKAVTTGITKGLGMGIRSLTRGSKSLISFVTKPTVKTVKAIKFNFIKPVTTKVKLAIAKKMPNVASKSAKVKNNISARTAQIKARWNARTARLSSKVAKFKSQSSKKIANMKSQFNNFKGRVVKGFNKLDTKRGSMRLANSKTSSLDQVNAKTNAEHKAMGNAKVDKAVNARKLEAEAKMAENRKNFFAKDAKQRAIKAKRRTPAMAKELKQRDKLALEVTKATTKPNSIKATGFGGSGKGSRYLTPAKNELTHFNKHKVEFINKDGSLRFKNAEEYTKGALKLLNKPSPNVLTRLRKNGDITRFNPKTGEFAVMSNKGQIRTYFRPGPKNDVFRPNGYNGLEFNSPKEYFHGIKN